MTDERNCSGCGNENSCRELYQSLGTRQGPSTAWKSIAVFLLPIIVFIVSVAASKKLLAGAGKSENSVIFLSFLVSLAVTLVWITITSVIIRVAGNKTGRCYKEHD